jgi:hypothetical protein
VGAGADVVLDAVGGPTFAQALKAAGRGGRVIAMANVALQPSQIDVRDFYPKNVTIYGFQITDLIERGAYDPRDDLKELANLVATGTLTVHVDRTFTLDQAPDAHRHLERRANRGKVLLTTTSNPSSASRVPAHTRPGQGPRLRLSSARVAGRARASSSPSGENRARCPAPRRGPAASSREADRWEAMRCVNRVAGPRDARSARSGR